MPNFCSLPTRTVDAGHMLGRIHSLESFGTVDGPGVRFVVFLQGCMFRCLYCHNRDTWDLDKGNLYSVEEVMSEIRAYYPFIESNHGGVTVSGGEPLLQRDFVCVLFKILHFEGIHTCLDTNGHLAPSHYDQSLEKLLSHTRLIMLDLKHMDEAQHKRLTGINNHYPLSFARFLHQHQQPVWIRYVVVPGYSDQIENAKKMADFLAPMKNVERVELLPYHELGAHKWKMMGVENPLEGVHPPPREKLDELAEVFHQHGVQVSY